jgi:hypothetical protein
MRDKMIEVVATGNPSVFSDTGIKSLSPFHETPVIHFPLSFRIDVMHLLCINITVFFMKLWTPPHLLQVKKRTSAAQEPDEPWHLPKHTWEAIGKEMKASRSTIPSSLGRTPRNIWVNHGSFEAIE